MSKVPLQPCRRILSVAGSGVQALTVKDDARERDRRCVVRRDCPPPVRGLRVQGSGFRVQGSGFRVQGSGFRVQGSGFRVQGSGFRVQGSGFKFSGLGFMVYVLWFRISGLRFRVSTRPLGSSRSGPSLARCPAIDSI